jgi:hypothetical protein
VQQLEVEPVLADEVLRLAPAEVHVVCRHPQLRSTFGDEAERRFAGS